jgi:hypothetical protein
MLKINSSNNHFQTFEKHLLTINNNEIYQKLRPLKIITNIFKEHQAHGDDIHIQISEKSPIPPKSSSSNQFSITDTSNEALKTDDENGMTKSYFLSKGNSISVLSRFHFSGGQIEIPGGRIKIPSGRRPPGLESCTGTSFCTRTRTGSFFLNRDPNRTGIAIPGPEPDPNTSTRTRTQQILLKT